MYTTEDKAGNSLQFEMHPSLPIGEDENTTSIVLDNGYVMPEEYFQARGASNAFSRGVYARSLARPLARSTLEAAYNRLRD